MPLRAIKECGLTAMPMIKDWANRFSAIGPKIKPGVRVPRENSQYPSFGNQLSCQYKMLAT
ncbi:MAG: hypothetical protein C0619_00305 [Desulfuromonas sp.]|nr:MAG: hypothetical protein C0619_00305 [Desulfuromonas sp.]